MVGREKVGQGECILPGDHGRIHWFGSCICMHLYHMRLCKSQGQAEITDDRRRTFMHEQAYDA